MVKDNHAYHCKLSERTPKGTWKKGMWGFHLEHKSVLWLSPAPVLPRINVDRDRKFRSNSRVLSLRSLTV